MRTYKTKLKLNNKQRTQLHKNAGVARFAYNLTLEIEQNNYKEGNKFLFNNCKFLSTSSDKIACRFVTVSLENETVTHEVIINNFLVRNHQSDKY